MSGTETKFKSLERFRDRKTCHVSNKILILFFCYFLKIVIFFICRRKILLRKIYVLFKQPIYTLFLGYIYKLMMFHFICLELLDRIIDYDFFVLADIFFCATSVTQYRFYSFTNFVLFCFSSSLLFKI